MKQMLLLLAVLTALTGLTAQTQQAPMYLLFNSSCMNQLEYRYTYTGASVMAYAYSPNANQTYILNAGNSGINAPSLPPGTLDCRSIKMDQTIMDAINKLQRQVYVVHQTQQGYLLMPLISAMQIERAGTYYFFRNPNYQFALDTMNLVYQANLSTAGSPNRVYFNGLRIMDCVYQYSFRSEPTQTNREKSDFEFIPSIGITVSNSGLTAAEMETNSLRLWRINGMSLEDYVSGMCHSGTSKPAAGIPAVAGVREDFQKTQPIGPPSPAPTVAPAPVDASGCTEVGGNGFHVVQKGETLMAISRQYKTPMKTLVAWNKIDNPDMIKPCQKLYVKNPASMTAVPTTPPPTTQPAPTISQPKTTPAPAAVPGTQMVPVHIVQSGETLSGIAKKYSMSEELFRLINNLPMSGNVVIYPGQQFMTTNLGYTKQPKSDPVPAVAPPPTTPVAGGSLQPLEHNNNSAPPPPTVLPANTVPPPSQPVSNQFKETSVLGNTTIPATPAPAQKATYYQEYIVQQGDTMNSIAIKFSSSPQELSLLNNKEPNEALIAGQRLLIPKQ